MLIFHVIASANHDRKVFLDPDVVTDVFAGFKAVAEDGVQVAAYAIMPSHLHGVLGVETPEQIGPAVKRLIGPAAQRLNERFEQRGAIFRHPFWRAPVLSDSYQWVLPLYVHANPAPQATDPTRLDVGLRSSERAYATGLGPEWLRPELLREQYGADYRGAMQEFLDQRAARRALPVPLGAEEDWAVLVVARATGVAPRTLCDATRGGKPDRMVLAWALTRACGASRAAIVLGAHRQTVARWAESAEGDATLAPWLRTLGHEPHEI